MQRDIGGIDVEDDLLLRRSVGLQKSFPQQLLEPAPSEGDLRLLGASFQPVQPPHRLALAGQCLQQRIFPQRVVIIEILVAQRQTINPFCVHACLLPAIQKTVAQTLVAASIAGRFPVTNSIRCPLHSVLAKTAPFRPNTS